MSNTKYFICPMSKNVVDSVIELNSDKIGLLPTRRQIDFDGGYVNGWNTEGFYNYVRSKSNIVLERDHSGPNQGTEPDDGSLSHIVDSSYFDIIHIDPWKSYNEKYKGTIETIHSIKSLYQMNPSLRFEVGTEEDIISFSNDGLHSFLGYLRLNLTKAEWDAIEYVVIQSGVSLDLVNRRNKGVFDSSKFQQMINTVNRYDKKAKEHNGDYLSEEEYRNRFANGLSAINIGPEFAQFETSIYLENMNEAEIDNFYSICLLSNRWKRWVVNDVLELGKRQLIQVCGHYSYLEYDYRYGLPKINHIIKEKITEKLNTLLTYVE